MQGIRPIMLEEKTNILLPSVAIISGRWLYKWQISILLNKNHRYFLFNSVKDALIDIFQLSKLDKLACNILK